jgi:hypothetical protein
MNPFRLAGYLGALLLPLVLLAEDKEKKGLFDTFFLDGPAPTWIVTFRNDRTFDLVGPDGRAWSGTLKASQDEISLRIDETRRHFAYKLKRDNLEWQATDKDTPDPATTLGQLPPLTVKTPTLFINKNDWIKLGRAVSLVRTGLPVAAAETNAANDPGNTEAAKHTTATDRSDLKPPEQVAGQAYYLQDAQGVHRLRFEAEAFHYQSPTDATLTGTYFYFNGELSLQSETHARSLELLQDTHGIQMRRRVTDVLKDGDLLGGMPPQANRLVARWSSGTPAAQTNSEEPEAHRSASSAPSAKSAQTISAERPETKAAQLAQEAAAAFELGDYRRAEKLLEQALQAQPADPDLQTKFNRAKAKRLLHAGDEEQARGNFAAAQRCYAEAARIHPELQAELDLRKK